MKLKTRNTILVAMVLTIAALFAIATRTERLPEPENRKPAPEVALSLVDGSMSRLTDYRGKTVLGVFWSVSCKVCAEEIPHLNELYRDKDRYQLEVIGFNMPYDRPDYTVRFVQDRDMHYPVSFDIRGEIARAFGGIQLTPTIVLIDRQGRIVWKRTGRTNFDKLKKQLLELASES